MLAPVEAIHSGQWGDSDAEGNPIPAPPEWRDFVLMRDMHWTWRDLSGMEGEVPWYVQRFCLDFIGIINKQQRSQRG